MRHGVLLIDKPEGFTSHDVVAKVRSALHEKKIGHLGTLDPMATGLLVLCVGSKALKTIELFQDLSKEYETRLKFGFTSSTYDREGVIEETKERKGWEPPSQVQLNEVLQNHFTGEIGQVPPAHSAVHIDGKRAYEIIRKDPKAELDLPERTVTVGDLQLISYNYPDAMLRIGCSSGTYIRSIVHDLGQHFRCGAYVETLRRTRVGNWSIDDAHELESVAWGQVIPLKDVVANFPRYDLSVEEWEHIKNGRVIELEMQEVPLLGWHDDLPVALLERKGEGVKAKKVL